MSDQNGGSSAGSLTEGFEVTSSVERGEIVVATDHGAVDEYLGECPHPTTALNALERVVVIHRDHRVGKIQGPK